MISLPAKNIRSSLLVVLLLLVALCAVHVARDRNSVLSQPSNASLKKASDGGLSRTSGAVHFENYGIKLGPFPEWNVSKPLPCFPLERDWNRGSTQRSPATTGILFVKPVKVGSTTAASVTLRIASKAGKNENISLCKNRVQHSKTFQMKYDRRDMNQSILWSLVREPTSRTISQFFHFFVTRREKDPTDEHFLDFIQKRRELLKSFQLKYLAFEETLTNPNKTIEKVFQHYNLIGVTERFDETVVVLQMLLGLDIADVLYVSAKGSGGYDDGRYRNKCYLIQKSFVSPRMRDYFQSSDWKEIIYWDEILHRAANYALDMRIEQLGRQAFESNLANFRYLKDQVDKMCGDSVRLPCSSTGQKRSPRQTDCIYDDMGCGFECMEKAVDQMRNEKLQRQI